MEISQSCPAQSTLSALEGRADRRLSTFSTQIDEESELEKGEGDAAAKEIDDFENDDVQNDIEKETEKENEKEIGKPKPWYKLGDIQQSYIYAKPAEPIRPVLTTNTPTSAPSPKSPISPNFGASTPMGMTFGYTDPTAPWTPPTTAAKVEAPKTAWSPRPFNIRSPSMVSLANSLGSTFVDTASIRSGTTARTTTTTDQYGWETTKASMDSQRTVRNETRNGWSTYQPPAPQPSKQKRGLLFRVLNKQ